MCLLFWPLGLVMIIVGIAQSFSQTHFACSECGNAVLPTSALCPSCKAYLK